MTEFQPIPFGKYTLLERIGVGPMAEFFRGTVPDSEGGGETVFVKRLLPHLTCNQTMVDAFSGAARITSHLEHKNIATVFDYGTIDGAFYLATEYLAGYSLQEIMTASKENEHPIGLESALYIASEICQGLAYAHGFEDPDGIVSHVVHSNLSPQSIFITSNGQVKLTDFGIYSENRQDRTAQLDMMKWKLAYMSPEQVGGASVDKRTDIFSLGLLLYEMVTGTQVFQGETMEVFSMVRQAHFDPPEKIVKDLPPKFCQIIQRCLGRAPAERYPSAGAMLEDVQEVLTTVPVRPSAKTVSQCLNELFSRPMPAEKPKIKQPQPVSHSKRTQSGNVKLEPKVSVITKPKKESAKKPEPVIKKKTKSQDEKRGMQKPAAKRSRSRKTPWMVAVPALMVISLIIALFFMDDSNIKQTSEAAQPAMVKNAYRFLETGNYQQAVFGFEQALADDPAIRDEISHSYARALDGQAAGLLQEDPEQAESLLLTAHQFDPQSVQICARLGLLYLNLKKYHKAIDTYERAVRLDPQLADAFFNLGYVYAVTKDFSKAQEMYKQAVSLSPTFLDEALFNLAVVQSQVGNRKESIKNLKRAIEINPKNKQAKQYLQTLTS